LPCKIIIGLHLFQWIAQHYRGNYYEYSDEALTAFPAIKEFRWIDLRSFRLKSDRMQHLEAKAKSTDVHVKPDGQRSGQAYVFT
jgi:hypothetical protein